MRMRSALAVACLAIGSLAGSTASQAASYNLTTDYSNTDNPNGPWSYLYDGNPLAHQSSAAANGNPLIPAIPADGYFSTGNDLNSNTPDVLKAAVNGSSAGETDLDFLAGDIVVHSPNDATKALTIVWTAPSAGAITNFSLALWYAHSVVSRSNDVTFSVAGVLQDTFPTSPSIDFNRNAPGTITGSYNVNAGDLLTLSFLQTAGQSFGSLTGVAESFDFAPAVVAATPVPAALPLFVSGLVGLGWFGHRKRKQAA